MAEARGHRVFPTITTIQDFKSQTISRILSDDIDALIQKSLAKIKSNNFLLSIYFGRNLARHYDLLSHQLSFLFQAPLLQASFVRNKKWTLQSISPIPVNDIPENHKTFMLAAAKDYFARKRIRFYKRNSTIYDLAILVNPDDPTPPSDERAVKKFCEAAESIGFSTEIINKDDFARIPEFDALFIRETTAVNHYTYRFSRRASAEGLIVLDDPLSIVRCTNKVYLNEILTKAHLPRPQTWVIHKRNCHEILPQLRFPCILKQPDSSASLGVEKVETPEEFNTTLERLLDISELIIAQEFMPSEFDWRIGILDRKPLYACQYFMVKNHWQISAWSDHKSGRMRSDGRHKTLPLEDVPEDVLELAIKAANLIGDGLYGVDIKPSSRGPLVIEVNDNPSLEYHVEDQILKDELYLSIAHFFMERIQLNKRSGKLAR